MGIVYILLLVFACILFLVSLIFSAKTWRWLDIVVMLFLFVASIVFVSMFAMTMKARIAWDQKVSGLEKQLADLETSNQELLDGDPDEPYRSFDSIRNLDKRLERSLYGRGRIWRGCMPKNYDANNNTVTIEITPAIPGETTNSKINVLSTASRLFVFKEGAAENGIMVPRGYVGEFSTGTINGNEVTLLGTLVLDQAELASTDRLSTWALYEKMPIDDPDIFYNQMELNSENWDKFSRDDVTMEEYRNFLRTQMSAEALGFGIDSPEYNAFIDQYVFDGRKKSEIEQANAGFTIEGNTYYDLEFLKPWSKQVNANTESPTLDKSFTTNGEAQVPHLRYTENGSPVNEISFKKGDAVMMVDGITSQAGYGRAGSFTAPLLGVGAAPATAKVLEIYYRRPLNDFESIFRGLTLKTKNLDKLISLQTNDVNLLNDPSKGINQNANLQKDFRDKEITLLSTDNTNLTEDVRLAKEYTAKVEAELAEKKRMIAEHETAIEGLAQRISEMQVKWAEEAEARTQSVTGVKN